MLCNAPRPSKIHHLYLVLGVPKVKQVLLEQYLSIAAAVVGRLIQQSVAVQVDRYKGLLLKQRDIMIALTSRLNERDEQILMLQEELEAYDSHQK